LDTLLQEAPPDAVKVGALGDAAQVQTAAELLGRCGDIPMVLDPVLQSSHGLLLLSSDGTEALRKELLPKCTLVTPNIPEAAVLTGLPAASPLEKLAEAVLGLGAAAVLLKGGHAEEAADDLLMTRGSAQWLRGTRIETSHLRGTGCRLSSAIAALLAHGVCLEEACLLSKEWLREGMLEPICFGDEAGSPSPIWRYGHMLSPRHNDRVSRLCGVYVITEDGLGGGRSPVDTARAAVAGGACAVQLRAKGRSTQELLAIGRSIAAICRTEGRALFLVNDRVDIAVALDADGAHIGPEDIPPQQAREMLGPHRLLGISAGTAEEAAAARQWASYLGVGAIFGSTTKADAGEAVGPARIAQVRAASGRLPIVAIGGISLQNIPRIWDAGADAAAVISAVTRSGDMLQAVRALVRTAPVKAGGSASRQPSRSATDPAFSPPR
jgi:hydroxymethylpyrimidine kinase/phosphomethylpyrimidine kinase/thiamine-phosphate diphosphorylase